MTNPNELLTFTQLTKSVTAVASGVPNPLPPALFSLTEEVPGNKAQYVQLYGSRKVANRAIYGAPPRKATKQPISEVSLKIPQFANRMVFDQEFIDWVRDFNSYTPMQKMAMGLIEYQGREFRQMLDNTRVISIALHTAKGANWFDANDNLIGSSSGSVDSISQGIPTENTGQIPDSNLTSGYVIDSSWQMPDTNIVRQLRNLHMIAAQRSGVPLKYALYGKNVQGYIAQNQSARTYWPFQSDAATRLMNMDIPSGFCELEWINCQNMFWESSTGTKYEVFDPDAVVFLPEITRETYTLFLGSRYIPNMYQMGNDAVSVARGMDIAYGMGRYATWVNFEELIDVAFDTFLPKWKKPKAVFIAKVTI